MMFFINLPWQQFHGNTEGQCGTCDNNRTDDCRLPNGTVISSCEKMATHWNVSNNNSVCLPPKPAPTPAPCNKPPICQLFSMVFKDCLDIIPYEYFEEACNYDVCHMNNQYIGCASLQMYAEMCALAGVCIDWRPATNGVCDYKCDQPKVYKACGPQIPLTCDLGFNTKFISTPSPFSALEGMFWEGCYCPDGTMELIPGLNVCVNISCDYCILPEGQFKQAGETWVSDCMTCTCEETLRVNCMHVPCPTQEPVYCDADKGQMKISQAVGCCQQDICVCNMSLCQNEKQTCPLGFTPRVEPQGCCHTCVPDNVCVFNDTVYKPGVAVPKEKCKHCVCTENDSQTELGTITCSPISCQTQCPLGYEYQLVQGDCCGKCVQISCVVTSGNITHMVKPGDTWTPPNDKCVTYNCMKNGTQYIPEKIQHVCQPFFEDDCVPGTIVIDNCCPTCTLKNTSCSLYRNSTYLESNGCTTAKPVEMTACEGSCVTSSLYSMAANTIQHSCSCCQEVSTSEKKAEFVCPDGTKFTRTYIYVEKCSCYERECTLKEIPASKQRRRRR
ncbi:intestinal mucin-like protein [Clarias gariepinus]|uniref:intestinal mucin-like protein n=1 Tax=Clarias gariepinus TaxID=13013 RepID=UPI00234CBFA6|nr:intestinal mucin-like protein [Clarias gariepinus]